MVLSTWRYVYNFRIDLNNMAYVLGGMNHCIKIEHMYVKFREHVQVNPT